MGKGSLCARSHERHACSRERRGGSVSFHYASLTMKDFVLLIDHKPRRSPTHLGPSGMYVSTQHASSAQPNPSHYERRRDEGASRGQRGHLLRPCCSAIRYR